MRPTAITSGQRRGRAASAGPGGGGWLRPFPTSRFHSTFPRRWLSPASILSAEAESCRVGRASAVPVGAGAAGKCSSVMRLLRAESKQGSPGLSAPNFFLVIIFPNACFLSAFPSSSLPLSLLALAHCSLFFHVCPPSWKRVPFRLSTYNFQKR